MHNSSTTMEWLTRLAWLGVLTLTLIGIGAVVGRATFLPDMGARLEPVRMTLLELLGRSDPLVRERAAAVAEFDGRFAAHPFATAVHIAAGGLYLLLVPLQLWRRFRTSHPAIHRVSGRIALAAGLAMVLTALYFGILLPFAGIGEAVTMALMSTWYAFTSLRAVRAIRNGDVARHREWMLRAIAVPLGVSVIRIAGLVLELTLVERGLGPQLMFQLAIWSGWISSIVVAEVWIRASRAGALARATVSASTRHPEQLHRRVEPA